MIAKALLPWFGGAASVWTVCLLFFQLVLLAGYGYAHLTRPWPHRLILVASLASLPLSAPAAARPGDWGLLATLGLAVGVPYFVLAANSPLMQRWSASGEPYRLYSLSNLASLVALLAYPVLIEPWISLRRQLFVWTAGYIVFVLLSLLAVTKAASETRLDAALRPPAWRLLLWAALAGCGSALLAATTNQMSQEVAPVPAIWILPLAIYLTSFILCFDHPRWYDRRLYSLLTSLSIPMATAVAVAGAQVDVRLQLLTYALTLFACLMLLHGELAASRPAAEALTVYYLCVAAGGAAGGAFVALGAPRLFQTFAEYPILLAISAALVLAHRFSMGEVTSLRRLPPLARSSLIGLGVATLVPIALFETGSSHVLAERRNFYGVLRVTEREESGSRRRVLAHGQTTHGLQLTDPNHRRTPTAYYGWATGAGVALEQHPRRKGAMRVGVIGLGVGTLARYGRPGDVFRFYEINPDVIDLARRYFHYLGDSGARIEIVEGDARLQLRGEPAQNFDALVVDAFSSDSIPVHLLTAECGGIYRRHLAPGGYLLIHISNRTLNLEPVVHGLGSRIGYSGLRVDSGEDPSQGVYAATWMNLTPEPTVSKPKRVVIWTDDFASLWRVLR